ncbi:unnamed protein product [Lactuca saligna]|uniref:Myb-like domain-containing protein n=1 Tax=Lactuca saligna TaxID=75948 RepID=A0AA35YBZ1_LACSI|nr:unnamed protein product [Lactuca saligna]
MRAPCKGWANDEERALAQYVSEDPIHDNDQDSTIFKEKVWLNFCQRMKNKYRDPDSLYSKWRTAKQVAMEFNGIYLNVIRNPQSDATEVDFMAKVRHIYKAKVRRAFVNESFWGVVKGNRK